MNPPLILRDLPLGFRLGLTAVIAVFVLGILSSAFHTKEHYENRDGRAGLTLDDLEGAYHGLDRPAPLLSAIEGGHPEGLDPEAKKILTDWLNGDRVVESYDDLDLGDFAPAELIAVYCLDCHSRQSTGENAVGDQWPLDYFDDVKPLAFSQRVEATPVEVLAASTHAHALSLATLTLVVFALAWCTRWPRRFLSILLGAVGLGLLGDIGGWWLARESASAVGLIVVSGSVYNGGTSLLLLLVTIDLWRPRGRELGGGAEGTGSPD